MQQCSPGNALACATHRRLGTASHKPLILRRPIHFVSGHRMAGAAAKPTTTKHANTAPLSARHAAAVTWSASLDAPPPSFVCNRSLPCVVLPNVAASSRPEPWKGLDRHFAGPLNLHRYIRTLIQNFLNWGARLLSPRNLLPKVPHSRCRPSNAAFWASSPCVVTVIHGQIRQHSGTFPRAAVAVLPPVVTVVTKQLGAVLILHLLYRKPIREAKVARPDLCCELLSACCLLS